MIDATTLEIQPLTAARFDDLALLFDEGGDPRWCWCTYFRFRGRDWTNSSAAGNRGELEARADDDPPAGLLAYLDGRVVGWVSVGPREQFGRLASSRILSRVDDTPVWSIVCFVVSRRARGHGVARRLLTATVEHARRSGATALEAYPVDTDGQRITSANAFHGTLSMFEEAGFESSNAVSGTRVRRSGRSSGSPCRR